MMDSSSHSTHAQPNPLRRLGSAFLLVLLGATLATLFVDRGNSNSTDDPVFPMPFLQNSLYAQESTEPATIEGAEYTYFTFRRNLWAIHRATGKVQFLVFPDGNEQQLQRSVTHQIDQEMFPVDQVEYQLSERNLTNFLWVLNPVTGKARYLRAARDAGLEVSEIQSVSRLGQ